MGFVICRHGVPTHSSAKAYDAAGNSTSSSVQVSVQAPVAGRANLALAANGGTISDFSNEFDDRALASYVLDGKRTFDTAYTSWWVQNPAASEHIAVGFDTTCLLDSVSVVNDEQYGARSVTLEYTLDGATWLTLGTYTDLAVTAGQTNDNVISFAPVLAKGVKVTLTPNDTGGLQVCEIEAYGTRVTSPPTDTTAPTVSITSPTAGSTVSGSVAIAATAADADPAWPASSSAPTACCSARTRARPYASTWNAASASIGSHTLTARAVDASGNAATSTVSVTVPTSPDTAPPAPVTTLSAARTGSATLYWTNPSDADFAGVRVLRSTTGFATSATDTVGQLNIYEGTAATYHDATAPDTAVYYSVFARDTAGNWSSRAQVSLPAVPDTTVPTVSITSPTAGSTVSGSVAIAATAADADSGMARVEFRADGVLLGTDTTAPYASTWNAASATYGSHTLTARAVDVAGNAATSTVSVNIADAAAPTVSITSPTAGSTVSGSVAIAATAADAGSGMARVEFRADGVLLGTDTTAPYASTWNAASATYGSHTLTARAVDVAGNAATSTVSVNIADAAAPTVSITSPTAGSTVSGSVAVAATAADAGSGMARVEFRADGVLLGTDTTAPYASTWNAASASVGSHTLTARAVDVAGNAATSTVSVTVPTPPDTTPPAIAITAPANGDVVSGLVAIPALASDDVGVARVEYRVDGQLVFTDTAAPYTATWDASSATAGSHTILVAAYDAAGNSTSSSVSVMVLDTTAPAAVTALVALRDGIVTLSWVNPTDTDFAGVRVLRSTSGFAVSPTDTVDQATAYEGTGLTYQEPKPEEAVYYSLYAQDMAGNWSARTKAYLPAVAGSESLATSMTLSASSAKISAGRTVVLRGKLMASGVATPDRADVVLWKKVGTGAWSVDTTATYNSSTGYYEAKRAPRAKTSYQFRFAGDTTSIPQLGASQSPIVTVRVTTSTGRVAVNRSSVPAGSIVTLSVYGAGPPPDSVRVASYRLVRGHWRYAGSAGVYRMSVLKSTGAGKTYRARIKKWTKGTWRYRAVIHDENGYTWGQYSKHMHIR